MIAVATSIAVSRIVLIILSLMAWQWTQQLLSRRNPTAPPTEGTEPGRVAPVSAAAPIPAPTKDQDRGDTTQLFSLGDSAAERARLIQRLIDGDEGPTKLPAVRTGERPRLIQKLLGSGADRATFLDDLIATMAVSVAGTEAVAFDIVRDGINVSLKTIAHIRPDASDAGTRVAALNAFQELVKPCIVQSRDGALEVAGGTAQDSDSQYCLITLLRDSEEKVEAVVAIITRCPDLECARQRLLRMQIVAGYYEIAAQRKNAKAATPPTPRSLDSDLISDGIHRMTARLNQRLIDNPRRANALLIASSLVIDLLGIYLLVSAVTGTTIAPFLGLFMVFGLRQICQAFCPLPPPHGMIWRSPGVPSLLVTYGTSCDLFFSGHTAIAVYGCATLADALGTPGVAIGCAIVVFEIWTVLILRAHYTMDVFTGALAALYVHRLALEYAPIVDHWIANAVTIFR
jgi:hypothetical protein